MTYNASKTGTTFEFSTKIQSFTDLRAWQEAHKLALELYKITYRFPKPEIYGLSSQLQRAAVSITSNIAEGFSRRTAKEKQQFYITALGSLTETENQLILSKDLGYVNEISFKETRSKMIDTNKLIHGLIKSVADWKST